MKRRTGRCPCGRDDKANAGQDRDHFEITLKLDDWLAMVRIAREADAALVASATQKQD